MFLLPPVSPAALRSGFADTGVARRACAHTSTGPFIHHTGQGAEEAVGNITTNSSICVQIKRGPADAFVNLLQGSLKKNKKQNTKNPIPPTQRHVHIPSPSPLRPWQRILLLVEKRRARPLIFSLLVLAFLKPQGKEEERKE